MVLHGRVLFENNILSTFINIPKILCLALMAGSENRPVMMTISFGRHSSLNMALWGKREKAWDSWDQKDI